MRKKIVYLQIALTFIITWGCWIGAQALLEMELVTMKSPFYQSLYYIGGIIGPGVATWLTLKIVNEKEVTKEYMERLFKWRVKGWWYSLAYIINLGILIITISIVYIIDKSSLPSLETAPLYMIILYLPIMIFLGGLEELGWRGIILPELLKTFSPIKASIILGLIWGLWHMPIFWILPIAGQYGMNFAMYMLGVIGISLVMTWIYMKTQSTLVSIVYHAGFNCVYLLGPASYGIFIAPKINVYSCIGIGIHLALGTVLVLRYSGQQNVYLK